MDKNDIKNYLLKMGFKPCCKGYRYIADLIFMNLSGVDILPLKYKGYPMLHKKYGTSCQCIDKNIQNCISKAWLEGDLDFLYREYGNTIDSDKGKPGVKQFLFHSCEKIKFMQNNN